MFEENALKQHKYAYKLLKKSVVSSLKIFFKF